jgi:hypothetical protein
MRLNPAKGAACLWGLVYLGVEYHREVDGNPGERRALA